MQAKSLFKSVSVALATATLAVAAWASPVVYVETPTGTGDLPGTAETAAASIGELQIQGTFLDGNGGNPRNLVDLYGFSITNAGRYFFNTIGSEVADTRLFLFDSAGNGLVWNNDYTDPATSTLSALDSFLDVGSYFIGVSFGDMDPFDGATMSIFDTLGSGGGALSGSGALAGWTNFNPDLLFDRSSYVINAYIPTPSALALALAALGLMAGVSARRRAA
ncbi:MAG: hypothetical protein ING89_04945 [Rubrivivax sp.]|nr:hypothetical protein [Rubrivivax sp.]